jgi:hypothetical protein
MRKLLLTTAAAITLLIAVATQADWYPLPPPRPIMQPWKSGATTVTLSPDGTLRVSGVGAMEDYDYDIFDFLLTMGKASPSESRNTPPEWYRADWYGNDTTDERGHKAKEPVITKIIIEDGVTYIGDMAFAYLHGLKSVTIPNSVTKIGRLAFMECDNLTSVKIPNSVTAIGRSAFFRCTELTSATLPDCLTVIRDDLFGECYNLAAVNIPNGVTEIEFRAFGGCALTSVTIPNSVKIIREEAFSSCALTSVTIPNGVTTIGEEAFKHCRNLTSVTIPESVMELGRGAFAHCPNLTSIIIRTPTPPDVGHHPYSYSTLGILCSGRRYNEFVKDTNTAVFDDINWCNACLYVPANDIDAYRAAEMWNKFYCIKSIESISSDKINTLWLRLALSILTALILSAAVFVVVRKLLKSSRKGIV